MQDQQPGEALSRLRDGGERALADLFVRHRERLRRMIDRRMDQRLSKRIDASDILQEGFVDAARRLDGYLEQPNMPLMLWLDFLLRQRIVASYRRHLRCQKRSIVKEESCGSLKDERPRSQQDWQPCSPTPTPSQVVSQREMRKRLSAAINQLEPLDREIIRLRHQQQLSNSEAAEQLGLSPSAASKRYVRALERLKRLA